MKNLNKLTDRLNTSCNRISATQICYRCIKTNPVQSEIKLLIDSSGTGIERVMDITTPDDGILRFLRLHRD